MLSKINVILIAVSILAVSILVIPSVSVFGRPNLRLDNTNWASLNWAGYVDYSGTYGSATGSWQVPAVSTTTTGYSSVWVGIGGFNGNTVIQIGTEQDCLTGGTTAGEMRYHGINDVIVDSSISNGKSGGVSKSTCNPVYYVWWELYPQNAEQRTTMTVSPNDSITASVSQSGTSWTLTITDNTNHQSYSTIQTPTFVPDQSSQELIVERPALCTAFSCKLTSLANFGTVTFSSGSVDVTNPIWMVNNRNQILAQPIPPTDSVQWVRSS